MSGLCTCFLPSRYGAFIAITCAVAAALGGTTGCQSVPRLRSPAGVAWNAAPVPATVGDLQKSLLTAVPDFDLPAESSTVARAPDPSAVEKPASEKVTPEKVVAAAATAEGLTSSQVNSASTTAPSPTETTVPAGTDPTVPAGIVQPGSAASGSVSASPAPSTSQPSSATTSSPATTQVAKADGRSASDSGPVASARQDPVVNQPPATDAAAKKAAVSQNLPAYSERRPEAFAWRRTGRTAGGRPFEISLTGENGFRTLFIGSAVGNDPISMKLMDRLARHLHENGLILGGFEVAVIHTLNPDGAASGQPTNALGRYVNGRFPLQPDQKPAASTPEVDFLLGCIRSFRPQRVVHVRTIGDSAGVIACNERCAETVEQIAEGLKFSRLSIPSQTREGTLEHCLSSQADLDVITLALPLGEKAEGDPWTLYGDTLLNLLQPRSIGGREANRGLPKGGAETP